MDLIQSICLCRHNSCEVKQERVKELESVEGAFRLRLRALTVVTHLHARYCSVFWGVNDELAILSLTLYIMGESENVGPGKIDMSLKSIDQSNKKKEKTIEYLNNNQYA